MTDNFFIIHGSFGNPFENWFGWLQKELRDKGFEVYTPDFPTGVDFQNYDNWEKLLKYYVDVNLIGENTTIIAHSIAPVFICKFLCRNSVKIKKLISVCSFNDYFSGNETFDNVNKSMFSDNYSRVKSYCKEIVCFYSDNDPYIPYDKLKEFADMIANQQVLVKGAGHINTSSGYTKFEELLKYI